MMEHSEPNVGTRIRALREAHDLSLRALAELSGLSVNAISLIERGENSPTVSSLHMLATALGVSITELFHDEQAQGVVVVTPQSRLRAEANGILMASLGTGLPHQQIEPFLLTVEPDAGTIDQPIAHPGEEFVFCLQGTIDYCIQDHVYRLETGYSLLFDAGRPHCFRNPTTTPAQLIMVFHAGAGNHLARRIHLSMAGPDDPNEHDP